MSTKITKIYLYDAKNSTIEFLYRFPNRLL